MALIQTVTDKRIYDKDKFFNYSQAIKQNIVKQNPALEIAIREHMLGRGISHLKRSHPDPGVNEHKGWSLYIIGQYTKPEKDSEGYATQVNDNIIQSGYHFDLEGEQYQFYMMHPFDLFRHDMTSDYEHSNMINTLESKARFFEMKAISAGTEHDSSISEFCIVVAAGQYGALLVGGKDPATRITLDKKYLDTPAKTNIKSARKYTELENMLAYDVPTHLKNKLSSKK